MRGSREPLEARLWARMVEDENGCWLWTGPLHRLGYPARVKDGDRFTYAHRLAYMIVVGCIPDGHELDHLCRVRRCCNPAHLEAVTHRVNMQRAVYPVRTHCVRGHAFTPETEYVSPDGRYRQCRVCRRDAMRVKRALMVSAC